MYCFIKLHSWPFSNSTRCSQHAVHSDKLAQQSDENGCRNI